MPPFELHLFGSAQTEVPPTSAGTTGHHDAPPIAETEPPKVSSPRLPGGKLGVSFSRIVAAPGATIEEPTEETGWRAHTVRAAISRLRRRGFPIALETDTEGRKAYRLAGGEGRSMLLETSVALEKLDGSRATDGTIRARTDAPSGRRSRSIDRRADLPARLTALGTMERDDLVAEWCRQFRVNPPERIRRELLELAVAWKLQEKALGGLKKAVATELRGLAEALATTDDIRRVKTARLKPGARLVREWGGATHEVTVADGGYLWNGEVRKSLSAIAEEITGAHWSGPRFFGLTSRAKPVGAGSVVSVSALDETDDEGDGDA